VDEEKTCNQGGGGGGVGDAARRNTTTPSLTGRGGKKGHRGAPQVPCLLEQVSKENRGSCDGTQRGKAVDVRKAFPWKGEIRQTTSRRKKGVLYQGLQRGGCNKGRRQEHARGSHLRQMCSFNNSTDRPRESKPLESRKKEGPTRRPSEKALAEPGERGKKNGWGAVRIIAGFLPR